MAEYFKGTLLASPVVRGSSGDTYGTHHSVLGVGGYMEVKTISERDQIPVNDISGIDYDGVSSGQRRLGMLVHVLEDSVIYRLLPRINNSNISLSQWNALTDQEKINELSNNDNWHVLNLEGGTTSNASISNRFRQENANFDIGDVVGYDGSEFVRVNSTISTTIEPLGFITSNELDEETSEYEFNIVFAGYIDTTNFTDSDGNSLTGGSKYYLSSSYGKITLNEPTGNDEVSKPMLVTIGDNEGIVLQYRGRLISDEPVSQEEFDSYTGETQTVLDGTVTGATNAGFFSGYTGEQTLNITYGSSEYNGEYISQYNYYYRDISGNVRLGAPVDEIKRRGYVRTEFPVVKSWIYNYDISGENQVGWIFVDGDVRENIGEYVDVYRYYDPTLGEPFILDEWEIGTYTGETGINIDVSGSLYTGDTYTNGSPVYRDKHGRDLRFRIIKSTDESVLNVHYDDNFIYLSGATLTGGTDQQTYNLSSPATCTVGGIPEGTVLTGLTAFELFEKILVPEKFGTLTSPSLSTSLSPSTTLYEINCTISSLSVNGNFNRGCINPQYCSDSDKRVGQAYEYEYTGDQVSGVYSSTSNTISKSLTDYTVQQGTKEWSVTVNYQEGVQPKGSDGSEYDYACPPGSLTNTSCIVGAYPLYGTTSSITSLSKQSLVNMSTANNVQMTLVSETGGNKQKFDIPDTWLNSRPLAGVCQYNTASSQWEYPGGSQDASLDVWSTSSTTHNIQGNTVDYTQYTYNGVDRGTVCIRLVF